MHVSSDSTDMLQSFLATLAQRAGLQLPHFIGTGQLIMPILL